MRLKRTSRSAGGTVALFLFLAAIGAVMVLPLVYTVVQALKPLDEIFIFPPRFWVKNPTLNNLKMLFSLTNSLWVPFSRYAFNSLFLTGVCTCMQVLFASMAAYPLAKHDFRGKSFIFNLIVLALLFTYDVTFIPQYVLVSKLKIINTYLAMILPSIAFPLGLCLMRQNLLGFPDSVLEAARIDGAKERTIFWRIIMPSVKPVWMTMLVFSFGGLWNRSDTNYIFSEQLKGLQTLLQQLSAGGIARMGVSAATTLVLIIPPILVFIIAQSQVIETMANSGMKE